jgi:hypothetical protein
MFALQSGHLSVCFFDAVLGIGDGEISGTALFAFTDDDLDTGLPDTRETTTKPNLERKSFVSFPPLNVPGSNSTPVQCRYARLRTYFGG